jgi:nitroreductase
MGFRDLVTRSRSCRRFDESGKVGRDVLEGLVELACLAPSSANRQPLRYLPVTDSVMAAKVFGCLQWAGYLRDWPGPGAGERPPAYLLMLCREEDSEWAACDSGIAAQTIMLGAAELGLGACIIGAVDRKRLMSEFEIPRTWRVMMVIALGRPAETAVIDLIDAGGDIRYWRDAHGIHHVPKRKVADVMVTAEQLRDQAGETS